MIFTTSGAFGSGDVVPTIAAATSMSLMFVRWLSRTSWSKPWSGVTPSRSTSTPLACSITARLRMAVRTPVSSARSFATSAASASAGSALLLPLSAGALSAMFCLSRPCPMRACFRLAR
nr:hypothetical protein [Dactylosporangium vinaceum]